MSFWKHLFWQKIKESLTRKKEETEDWKQWQWTTNMHIYTSRRDYHLVYSGEVNGKRARIV